MRQIILLISLFFSIGMLYGQDRFSFNHYRIGYELEIRSDGTYDLYNGTEKVLIRKLRTEEIDGERWIQFQIDKYSEADDKISSGNFIRYVIGGSTLDRTVEFSRSLDTLYKKSNPVYIMEFDNYVSNMYSEMLSFGILMDITLGYDYKIRVSSLKERVLDMKTCIIGGLCYIRVFDSVSLQEFNYRMLSDPKYRDFKKWDVKFSTILEAYEYFDKHRMSTSFSKRELLAKGYEIDIKITAPSFNNPSGVEYARSVLEGFESRYGFGVINRNDIKMFNIYSYRGMDDLIKEINKFEYNGIEQSYHYELR